MLNDFDVLCFANDWTTIPSSKHHLMRRIAATNQVLWIEGAGQRRPNFARAGDWQRLIAKARTFTTPARAAIPGLSVYAPPAIPFPESPIARAINAQIYRATLQREMRRVGLSARPLIWNFLPHMEPLIRDVPRSFLVYHCVDRWSEFEDYNPELMERFEKALCERADLVLASAEDLAEKCGQHNDNVHYVPHGVDFPHFATALEPGELPDDLAAIPGPRIGFFGLLHEWVDLELIRALAERLPYAFVIIGEAKTKTNLDVLRGVPNIHLLGKRPFAQLPAYSRGFHAAIVPFRVTSLTMSVNPIKLREYAAAGLPVVSTDIPEVRRCGDIATCATDVESWADQLRRAVERGSDAGERRRQSERVRDQDWSAIVARMSALVNATAERRGRLVGARRPVAVAV